MDSKLDEVMRDIKELEKIADISFSDAQKCDLIGEKCKLKITNYMVKKE